MGFRRNVFILGAGFSAKAGAPLIPDFLDRARELFENPDSSLSDAERSIFNDVLDYRFRLGYAKAKLDIDLDNIEDLFGLLDMECQLAKDEDDPIWAIRRKLLYLIIKTLDCTVAETPQVKVGYLLRRDNSNETWNGYDAGLYDHFLHLVNRTYLNEAAQRRESGIARDAIITLNYDLILDHRMGRLGISPLYEINSRIASTEQRGSLYLLKLHGSSNWLTCRNCRNDVIVSAEKVTRVLPEWLSTQCENCGQAAHEPLIVPPTWNKGGQHPVMRRVWRMALEKLSAAQRIFILGYSVPKSDRFFDYLLGAALKNNRDLYEIIIVNKDDSIRQRYEEIFSPSFSRRYVHFEAATIEQWIGKGGLQSSMRQLWDSAPSRV